MHQEKMIGKFEKNNRTIVLNVLHVKKMNIYPTYISKQNLKCENKIILMISKRKWCINCKIQNWPVAVLTKNNISCWINSDKSKYNKATIINSTIEILKSVWTSIRSSSAWLKLNRNSIKALQLVIIDYSQINYSTTLTV